MNLSDTQDAAALRGLHELQELALQQGQHLSRSVPVWRPGGRGAGAGVRRRAVLRLTLAVAVGAALAAAGGMTWNPQAVASARVPRPLSAAPQAEPPQPFQAVEPEAPVRKALPPLRLESRTPTPGVAPPPAPGRHHEARIESRDGGIHMRLQGVPLDEAVRLLAAVTHATVHGQQALPKSASAVNVHWQGRDPDAAWRRLLGDGVSYASRCGHNGCVLWLTGPVAAPMASGAVSPAGVRRPVPPPVPGAPAPAPRAQAVTADQLEDQQQLAAFGVAQ